MSRRLGILLLLISGSLARAEGVEVTSSVTFDAVVVTGDVPGPGIWKITKDEHTLWVLGTLQPLPKKMKWRSQKVEALIAQSQEVISAGKVKRDFDAGFFESAKSIPAIIKLRHNPGDQKLQDILDAETYALWSSLREKYIGRGRYAEGLRPVFALEELRDEAYDELNLTTDPIVWGVVRKAARKHHVRITEPDLDVEIKIEHASQVVRGIADLNVDDRECFGNSLRQFESDMSTRVERANAWAVGDLAKLKKLTINRQGPTCDQLYRQALLSQDGGTEAGHAFAEKMQAQSESEAKEIRARWLSAIETAVQRNHTTLAVLPMYDLYSPQGRLALLREMGYTVEEPVQE